MSGNLRADYRTELSADGPAAFIRLIASVYDHVPFVVGCFCEDESRCHRAVLAAHLNEERTASGGVSRADMVAVIDAFRERSKRSIGAPTSRALGRFRDLLVADSGGGPLHA